MSDATSKSLDPRYAWRDVACKGLPARSAKDRAADFLEIYGLYDEKTAREQASRCIQCPNPTCVAGCPLCNPIPEWMQLTAEGRFLEAAALLGSVTNMAEICTRVCPSDHLCEESCILSAVSEPVSIRALEQFLIDYAFKNGQVESVTAPPNGLSVAVIGVGPGGLACAEQLAKRGYKVTIFDSEATPGALLVNGVPAFRLERSIVDRRIKLIQQMGVAFELNPRLWDEISLSKVSSEFDAVYLALDGRQARTLGIPGAHLKNVIQAVPFLLQKNTPLPLDLAPVEVAGKTVIVIGAGDTAMDCLRAAIRYGAKEVICAYRRNEPEMPCGRKEYLAALEEGARFLFGMTPAEIVAGPGGEVNSVRFSTGNASAETPSDSKSQVRGTGNVQIAADLVILALGFDSVPCQHKPALAELACHDSGRLRVDERQMTSLPGVFAGGDLVSGMTTLLEAVRDARRGAEEIHSYVEAAQTRSGGTRKAD